MFAWITGRQKQLDPERTYLRIQFLTAQQKGRKIQKIEYLNNFYAEDKQSIIPYEGSFPVSFTYILKTKEINGKLQPIQNQIMLKEVIAQLETPVSKDLEEFLVTQVDIIQAYYFKDQMVGKNDLLPLFSEMDVTVYEPKQILEVVFQQKGLFQRIKNRMKQLFKKVPSGLFAIFKKIVAILFSYFGFGSTVKNVIWKLLPMQTIIQSLLMMVTMFFPMLGPILGFGKMFF